jgi:iron complex outermembrane receptor protein
VNFQSADPFGANEWSTRLTVRGFAQNQLGFTLDGVPLGDMSYANHNGLHASRAILPEDVREIRLSQGAGALGTASSSNLGGTVEFLSSDPTTALGARAGISAGSAGTRRIQGRLDGGLLAAGTRFFLSAADHRTGKWKGDGDQVHRNYTLKLLQNAGRVRITAFANHSDRVDIDYQDLSLDLIARRGYFWDNWAPDWNSAVESAEQCAASGFIETRSCDDAYWNSSTLRRDLLAYLGAETAADARTRAEVKFYLHHHDGQGLWATPYTPTPDGAPLSIRVTDYDIDRSGVISGVHRQLGSHQLQAGMWHESNRFNQARQFFGEPSRMAPARSFRRFQRDPFLTQWDYKFHTRTLQLHVQDEWQVSPRLQATFGARMLDVRNSVTTIAGPANEGAIRARDHFLPQAGVVYAFADGHEAFASVTHNLRAFVSAGFAGPFGTSAEGFAAIRDSLRPERSTTREVGWRLRAARVQASATLYQTGYRNRLLSIQPGPVILGNPAVLGNVGSVTTAGAELALLWKPAGHLEWFSSLAMNDSRFDDDYVTEARTVATSGRQLPDAPRLVLRTELSFDTGRAWIKLAASHVGKRYYSYLNDAAVPAYSLLNAGLGMRMGNTDLTLQLDVTNLTDKRHVATAGSTDFVESDATGTRQTLQNGAPRQLFVTLRARL